MQQRDGAVVPFSFDLSSLVQRSVASLYSHLVTRPTGRALRLGIESQLSELGTAAACISILDFTQVLVLDYSCADEAVAKLIQRFQPGDRPADAYFVARGVAEQHREPLEEVLRRHDLVLVAEVAGEGFTLLGQSALLEHLCWTALQRAGRASVDQLAYAVKYPPVEVRDALESLTRRRAVLNTGNGSYRSLTALLF